MRIWQGPREGTPGSWTPCVRNASRKYVYIATSDDTMSPDCLQKLVEALEKHPECDIAHCCLKTVDEKGVDQSEWWVRHSTFSVSSGELLYRPHVRRAPFDGLLHLLGDPVYVSITQLLIRRSLFDRIGLFDSRWGAVGDFNWCMRAGLVANTVHVPDSWGGWRIHGSQATAGAAIGSIGHIDKIEAMIEDAITRCDKLMAQPVRALLSSKWAAESRELRMLLREEARCSNKWERRALIARRLLMGSQAARVYLKARLPGRRRWRETGTDWVRQGLAKAGIDSVLVPEPITEKDSGFPAQSVPERSVQPIGLIGKAQPGSGGGNNILH